MERKKQLRMLGLAALLPLFVLVWVLSSEEPLPPGEKEAVEGPQSEIAEKPEGLNLEDKEDFKNWIIESSIVTDLEYPEGRDDHLQIKLEKDKYTTQEAAEKIAFHLARYYKMETGFISPLTLTILYPDKPGVFFEGHY